MINNTLNNTLRLRPQIIDDTLIGAEAWMYKSRLSQIDAQDFGQLDGGLQGVHVLGRLAAHYLAAHGGRIPSAKAMIALMPREGSSGAGALAYALLGGAVDWILDYEGGTTRADRDAATAAAARAAAEWGQAEGPA